MDLGFLWPRVNKDFGSLWPRVNKDCGSLWHRVNKDFGYLCLSINQIRMILESRGLAQTLTFFFIFVTGKLIVQFLVQVSLDYGE